MITKKLTTSIQYLLLLCGGFFCILFIYFLIDSRSFEDKIYRNIYLADIDVSYLTYGEFVEVLNDLQKDIETRKVFLSHEDVLIEVTASEIGLGFDPESLWNEVYQSQERDSILEHFRYWIYSFNGQMNVPAETFARKKLIDDAAVVWEEQIQAKEPFNGSLRVVGVSTEVQLPQPGYEVDVVTLKDDVIKAFINQQREVVISVPLLLIEPERNIEDITVIQKEVDSLIGLPITLYSKEYPGRTLVLGIKDISSMLRVSVPEDPEKKVVIDIDDEVLIEKIASLYPREAKFVISEDGKLMELKPSSAGFDINVNETVKNILNVGSQQDQRRVEFIIDQYIQPTFTTEDAEALNITHLVSQFTTYHSCCASRVENIHLVADILDGKILKPGESLAMNTFLGERTEERGFASAGTILKGRLEESVGGGISQFITTLHNAVYWGGYEVVDHKPHTIYFSRYPEGIEATINWPYVDYVFRNDTKNGLYINVEYTDTSITVSLYGSNYGRMAIGDQKGGSTNIQVTGAQPESRIVISEVSERYNYREPLTHYIADTSVPRGGEVFVSYGEPRFSVDVKRTIKENGELIRYDYWPVYYQQDSTLIRRHPCDFYDEDFDYGKC